MYIIRISFAEIRKKYQMRRNFINSKIKQCGRERYYWKTFSVIKWCRTCRILVKPVSSNDSLLPHTHLVEGKQTPAWPRPVTYSNIIPFTLSSLSYCRYILTRRLFSSLFLTNRKLHSLECDFLHSLITMRHEDCDLINGRQIIEFTASSIIWQKIFTGILFVSSAEWKFIH